MCQLILLVTKSRACDAVQVKPCLLHGDLWSGNYTGVAGAEGPEWAILDPAVYYGVPCGLVLACLCLQPFVWCYWYCPIFLAWSLPLGGLMTRALGQTQAACWCSSRPLVLY